jgi:adenylosuccinate lyase
MAANLELERPLWVAELLYILLARHGHPQAHEVARRLAVRVREEGVDLFRALQAARREDPELDQVTGAFDEAEWALLEDPRGYRGKAEAQARATAARWRARLAEWRVLATTKER